jgi:hypothetical protein
MSERLKPGLVPVGQAWPDVAGTGYQRYRASTPTHETGYIVAESAAQAYGIYREANQLEEDARVVVQSVGE